MRRGCAQALDASNVVYTINSVGSMLSIHFNDTAVTDFESAAMANNDRFKTFFHGMLHEGIYIAPSAFETWFICDALTYEDLDNTIAAVKKVAKSL